MYITCNYYHYALSVYGKYLPFLENDTRQTIIRDRLVIRSAISFQISAYLLYTEKFSISVIGINVRNLRGVS